MASGTKPHTTNEQTDLSWESPDQTSMNSTSYMKNPSLSKLKSTQPVNQKTPKAKFGTTNLSKILVVHQILRPYLYPQKPLPQIAPLDRQGSYQYTPWLPRRKPQLQPLPEEEDPVPHHHHCQQQLPPPLWTSFNKFKPHSTLPSADREEEEIPQEEETPQEEDQMHQDPQAVEELHQIL